MTLFLNEFETEKANGFVQMKARYINARIDNHPQNESQKEILIKRQTKPGIQILIDMNCLHKHVHIFREIMQIGQTHINAK